MGLLTASPPRHRLRSWLIPGLIGAAICLLALVQLGSPDRGRGTTLPLISGEARIAYVEFGRGADTLWLASTRDLRDRQRLLTLPHATDYGIVPSLAPDGQRFAFTALPPDLKTASADTPAVLWLASTRDGAPPRALADGMDLLVKPVWHPEGHSLVVRRSAHTAGVEAHGLVLVDVVSGSERELVTSMGQALFPIGFAPDANVLYAARLDPGASDLLAIDTTSGTVREAGRLAPGLTRDWTLSPGGDRIAYLEISLDAGQVYSRAYVVDTASGARAAVTDGAGDEFSPVWTGEGALGIGHANREGSPAGVLLLRPDAPAGLPGPANGFDVPLAAAPSGGDMVVRSFDGASALAPGRQTLTLVGGDGSRRPIASGEVTFLGWMHP